MSIYVAVIVQSVEMSIVHGARNILIEENQKQIEHLIFMDNITQVQLCKGSLISDLEINPTLLST